MSQPEITNQVRIQPHSEYWYTVEDFHLEAGCDSLTISYWESRDGEEKRKDYICIEEDAALSIADGIYKLFKKENSNG